MGRSDLGRYNLGALKPDTCVLDHVSTNYGDFGQITQLNKYHLNPALNGAQTAGTMFNSELT